MKVFPFCNGFFLCIFVLVSLYTPAQAQPFSKNAFKRIQKAGKRSPSSKKYFRKQPKPLLSLKQQEALKKWQQEMEEKFSAAAASAQLTLLTKNPSIQKMLGQFDEKASLSPVRLPPEISARNTKMAAFYRKHFLTRIRYIQNNREEVLQRITQTLSPHRPDYPTLLKDIKVVFMAVHHYDPFLTPASQEIVSLVKQYKHQHPLAQILIATEALSTTIHHKPVPLLTEENLSRKWLEANRWGTSFNPYTPLAQETGIAFLPLENYKQLSKFGENTQIIYAKSPAGLEDRNRAWAKRIQEERKRKTTETGEDYDLILVIAGEAHLRYIFPHNLPSIMKEKHSAVIDLSLREALLFSNYFWDKLPSPAHLSLIPPQYYVIKQTDPKTAQLLGADIYINTPQYRSFSTQ